jgi:hypothetical protein
MSQSQVLVGALLAGFVVYLAMNGKLAAYWKLLTGGGTAAPSTPTAGTTTTGEGGQLVAPQSPTGTYVPGGGLQIVPGMQGN